MSLTDQQLSVERLLLGWPLLPPLLLKSAMHPQRPVCVAFCWTQIRARLALQTHVYLFQLVCWAVWLPLTHFLLTASPAGICKLKVTAAGACNPVPPGNLESKIMPEKL